MHQLLRYIRAAVPAPAAADVPDRELLDRFARSRDEGSFAALVGRHGGGVWAACRRLVDRNEDAEDAFQAVFLTLARKAGSIRGGEALPAWLHGVARRVAANLRRDGRRRARAEAAAADRPHRAPADLTWREGLSVLDEELGRLPARYRAALIVCCLDGRSRDEAAAQLGWSPGQVKGRLERARQLLRRRLTRRGFELAGVLLAAAVARPAPAGAAPAGAPPSVVSATVKAAALVAAGQGMTAGAVSSQAAVLTEGVLHAMFIEKIKVMTAVLLALALAGGGLLTYRTAMSGTEPTQEAKGGPKAPGSKPEGPQRTETDYEKLQGAWRAVSGEQNGAQLPPADLQAVVTQLVFPRPTVLRGTAVVPGNSVTWQKAARTLPNMECRINPNTTPRQITFERTRKGIYELSGDTLKLCIYNPWRGFADRDYPSRVDGKGSRLLIVFQRVKEPEAPPAKQPRADRPLQPGEVNARMLRELGNRFDVEVIGRTKGVVSGTELYFYDSNLDTAAVHAGLTEAGKRAVITVTVVKCPKSGVGSTRHGVTSEPWDGAREGDTALVLTRRSAAAPPENKIDVLGIGQTAMELVKTTKDPDAKWMAVRMLGYLRYEPAIPLLLASLSDPHHYVRANAARALGDMRVAAAAKPLTELLKREKDGGVIQQTSLALANLHYAGAVPVLKAAAKHDDVQTRMWVLQAVGRLGGKRDVPFLARFLLDDPSSLVQMVAAQAIEQLAGVDFGFPRRPGPSGPEEGLKRARAWWQEHQGEY
jgi:RNA polymerase sigma-70 factor (ECF subfamily)